ncbi:MAG: STAS domain-containing protein [Chloroflexota bacterium]
MEIVTTQYKHCDLVKPIGRIDSYSAPQLETVLCALSDDDHFKIVIDLSESPYISSAGFNVLVSAQNNCKRCNRGEILLAHTPELIQSAFQLAGFDKLFRFYHDVISAVASF